MHKILEAALRDATIDEISENFIKRKEFLIYGLSGTQKVTVIATAFVQNPCPTIIVVNDREKISAWQNDLAELLPEVAVRELPELDLYSVNAETVGLERQARRLEILTRLINGEPMIVLATPQATVKKDFSRADFFKTQIKITLRQNLDRDELIVKLVNAGYKRVDDVDAIGSFSVRGDIVDVFAINEPRPYRIEFFDDNVDSIRVIDIKTLRTKKVIRQATILPIRFDGNRDAEPFLNCAGEDGVVIFDEPNRIKESIDAIVKEDPDLRTKIFSFDKLIRIARGGCLIYLSRMMKKIPAANIANTYSITAASVNNFRGQMDFFVPTLKRQIDLGRNIFMLFTTQKKFETMQNLLTEEGIIDGVNFLQGTLNEGFIFPTAQIAVITEREIYGTNERPRIRKSKNAGDTIRNFSEIKPGDYVVHAVNGIGKYLGIETLELEGIHRDYLNIQYGSGDKLYLPTDAVQFLQKYISDDDAVPQLSKLGSNEWARAKSRASAAVEDIAEKLLAIYAEREVAEGFAFDVDDITQEEFEAKFPYDETPDQIKAVEAVKADMESPRPMDRLICGDVGFGKTEIAIRAAYKAAMSGKQVAVLVPTTVLAQQHYQTFSDRLAGFAPVVDVICRFRTPREQRLTLQKVRAGTVDILIGTHAILNSKIEFKDLGLLIIDEEQRFGVKQKERIRSISDGVDILALSATPIPRTLHMSLVHARDMSLITTPPADRQPVQTYVIEDNDVIIADAILREIDRGGQVYFVYNRIESIELMYERLRMLVPEANIKVAHGRQSDIQLENIMMDFYEGNFNVLLCTTIIENGLDVSNANTIIIYDADRFGLAQLYQMRGRVGRSHQMAFAYFVHRAQKILGENAEKRLHAMKEFAELGAGFKIAMRDLEIRGAGNLLGVQQHGHIASVGFEMYCQLLEEAVAKLQNRPKAEVEPDPVIILPVEAYIDDNYIPNSMHKIEIYQRLAAIREDIEVIDMEKEIVDRFGKITEHVLNLLRVTRIKCKAKKLGIKSLEFKNLNLEIAFGKPKISARGFNQMRNYFKDKLVEYQAIKTIVIDIGTKKNLLNIVFGLLKRLEIHD